MAEQHPTTQTATASGGGGAASGGAPKVAATPGKTFIILGGLIVTALVIIFTIFGDEEPEEKKDTGKKKETMISKAPPIPLPPPPPPALPAPALVPPPPPPVDFGASNADPFAGGDDPTAQERLARIRSNMVIVNKGNTLGNLMGNNDKNRATPKGPDDPNRQFADSEMMEEINAPAIAGSIGDPNAIIAQGKVLDAVLETAINTDLPGMLRAVVNRDIYAESGRAIMLPKGSRLIGTYNTFVRRGQRRVFILWQRVIRPDGIDIRIASEGVDLLGRAGVEGRVDNRFMEIFSSSILTSIVTLGVAYGAEQLVGSENATTSQRTNSDGSSQTTGSPTALAAQEFTQNTGSVAKDLVRQYLDLRPVISVDQGTLVKVFVNRDLIFPGTLNKQVMFVK